MIFQGPEKAFSAAREDSREDWTDSERMKGSGFTVGNTPSSSKWRLEMKSRTNRDLPRNVEAWVVSHELFLHSHADGFLNEAVRL